MDSELAQLGSILNSMLQRLDDSFEQQARFVADASHELRTPISVLSMHCELALSQERKPEEYQKTLTTCLRASERMRSLVEDLLMLAKADAGQLAMRDEEIDLSLIVDESVQLLAPLAKRHRVSIETKTSSVLCRGDSNHLLRLQQPVEQCHSLQQAGGDGSDRRQPDCGPRTAAYYRHRMRNGT